MKENVVKNKENAKGAHFPMDYQRNPDMSPTGKEATPTIICKVTSVLAQYLITANSEARVFHTGSIAAKCKPYKTNKGITKMIDWTKINPTQINPKEKRAIK